MHTLTHTCHYSQELTERTGKNPQYQYVQVGCSKNAEIAMLRFARQQMGKPFSSSGITRALIWPRESDYKSWFCAELIAACLQQDGLMSKDSKTGGATPYSLHKMYKAQGAVQANPYALRQQFGMNARTVQSMKAQLPYSGNPFLAAQSVVAQPLAFDMQSLRVQMPQHSAPANRESTSRSARSDSPPRMQFKVIQARGASEPRNNGSIALSLASLNMNRSH